MGTHHASLSRGLVKPPAICWICGRTAHDVSKPRHWEDWDAPCLSWLQIKTIQGEILRHEQSWHVPDHHREKCQTDSSCQAVSDIWEVGFTILMISAWTWLKRVLWPTKHSMSTEGCCMATLPLRWPREVNCSPPLCWPNFFMVLIRGRWTLREIKRNSTPQSWSSTKGWWDGGQIRDIPTQRFWRCWKCLARRNFCEEQDCVTSLSYSTVVCLLSGPCSTGTYNGVKLLNKTWFGCNCVTARVFLILENIFLSGSWSCRTIGPIGKSLWIGPAFMRCCKGRRLLMFVLYMLVRWTVYSKFGAQTKLNVNFLWLQLMSQCRALDVSLAERNVRTLQVKEPICSRHTSGSQNLGNSLTSHPVQPACAIFTPWPKWKPTCIMLLNVETNCSTETSCARPLMGLDHVLTKPEKLDMTSCFRRRRAMVLSCRNQGRESTTSLMRSCTFSLSSRLMSVSLLRH